MIAVTPHTRQFERLRPHLFGLAYRMLGSVSDAEDVLQDAWLRWREVNRGAVESPRAYLMTTVSRLCIDRQRKRKVEKLNYYGPWLPEPILEAAPPGTSARPMDSEASAPADEIELAEDISLAFMHALETLSPLERAVFILKEAFDLSHDEVARTIGVEAAHSRQLLRRARRKLADAPEARVTRADDESRALMQSFMNAARSGDLDQLKSMLAEDVVAYSDGGGRVSAAIIPLRGIERVTTVLLHLMKQYGETLRFEWVRVNGRWGFVAFENGRVHSVTTAEIRGGKLHRVYTMRNPEKLRHVRLAAGN